MKKISEKQSKMQKSFTLIEMIVVVAVMGLILGGLVISMSQILNGEIMLSKMQAMEEESRYIMDLFAQDAQYSELNPTFKPDTFLTAERIIFILTDKRSDVLSGSTSTVEYNSTGSADKYYLTRALSNPSLNNFNEISTLNTTPLKYKPTYKVRKVTNGDAESYIISISLVFEVQTKGTVTIVPIETSVVSRIFEF